MARSLARCGGCATRRRPRCLGDHRASGRHPCPVWQPRLAGLGWREQAQQGKRRAWHAPRVPFCVASERLVANLIAPPLSSFRPLSKTVRFNVLKIDRVLSGGGKQFSG